MSVRGRDGRRELGGAGFWCLDPGPETHLVHAGLSAPGRSSGRHRIEAASPQVARAYKAILGGHRELLIDREVRPRYRHCIRALGSQDEGARLPEAHLPSRDGCLTKRKEGK